MLFPRETLDGIVAGRVTAAFRRWKRPRVRVGSRLRTAVGVVEVTSLDAVALPLSDADAREAGAASLDDLAWLAKGEGDVYRVGVRFAGADPRIALREQAELSADDIAELRARLARMDAASASGPWTRDVLRLIAERPAARAPDLAASLGRETPPFKRDVRKLKELGLTESLEVGYRLSPRGRALLAALDEAGSEPSP
ncbi:MAG: hypothetical protein ACM3S1_13025 [Hyphomicrobiales bacterium]